MTHSFPTRRSSDLNHLDHNGDLGNGISVGWMDGRTDPLLIYGPYGTEHMVAAALDYFSVPERIYMEQAIFSVPASSSVQPHDITKGGLVYSDGRVKVFAAENTHYQTFNAGRDKYLDRKSTRLNSST